jgi:hypothetical protein
VSGVDALDAVSAVSKVAWAQVADMPCVVISGLGFDLISCAFKKYKLVPLQPPENVILTRKMTSK